MTFESLLRSVPVVDWKVGRTIALDWYDGPRAGFCALDHPGVDFAFDLVAERPNDDGLDDRLFRVHEISLGSVAGLLSLLQSVGHHPSAGQVWAPVWKFSTEEARRKVDQFVRTVRATKRPTDLVISSPDLEEFLGCWEVPADCNGATDWFAYLNIPPAEPTPAA